MTHLATIYRYRFVLLLVGLALFMPFSFVYANAIAGFLYKYLIIGFFGWLVGLSAMVLDYGINYFVIGFGTQFSLGIGEIVERIWTIIRDLFNLTFIFGLVYIGFKMILRSDDGNTRRWLINLILAALLVNFSLFITKFVVDFSNILAIEIMNQANDGAGADMFKQTDDEGDDPNFVTLSGTMAEVMNIQTALSSKGIERVSGTVDTDDLGFTFVFGTLMVFLVAMFVFISAGILLIIRGAVLIVLMILSPFLFLGMVLPMFQGFSRNLWSTLLKRAFLAPIYIALLYIALSVAQTFMAIAAKEGGGNFSQTFVGGSGAGPATSVGTEMGATFGPFILICVLLLMSLTAAQKLGAEGSSAVMKVGRNLRQRGQRAVGASTFGMGARVGRSTVGAGADKLSRNRRFQKFAANSALGDYAMRATKKTADSSFDVRNAGGLGKATGLGTGKKGGFVTRQKEDQKRKEQMLKDLKVDTDTPEGQAEVESFRNEMTQRATQADETKDMSLDQIDGEIMLRETAVGMAKENIKRARQDNSTDAEIAALESELEINEKLLKQTQELKKEKEEIANLETTKTELDKEYETEAKQHGKNSKEAKAVFAQQQAVQQQIDTKQANIDTAGDTYRDRAEHATVEVKYGQQMEYMERLERTQQLKQNIAGVLNGSALVNAIKTGFKENQQSGPASAATIPSAGAVAPLAGLSATTGMAGTVVGGAAMAGSAHLDQRTLRELYKKVGRDAIEMAKKDKENTAKRELAKNMKEFEKEHADSPETPTPSTDDTETKTET